LYQANWYDTRVIRLQNAGGLGNQLFVWAAAHNLAHKFDKKVVIFTVKDRNTRKDRPSELQRLKIHCKHDVYLRESFVLGYILRVVDKLKLERYSLSRSILQMFGFYSIHGATDECNFGRRAPKIVRSYFQRNEYVDSSWEFISGEIKSRLEEIKIPQTINESTSQVIHFRRGDFVEIKATHGLLSVEFFAKNINPKLKNVFCTDDSLYADQISSRIPMAMIMTPRELDVWQTLKVFVGAKEFLGSNSTLSWWAAKIRSKTFVTNSSLPQPWTSANSEDERALEIPGVDFKRAIFED
jgi:hypothetical protein